MSDTKRIILKIFQKMNSSMSGERNLACTYNTSNTILSWKLVLIFWKRYVDTSTTKNYLLSKKSRSCWL